MHTLVALFFLINKEMWVWCGSSVHTLVILVFINMEMWVWCGPGCTPWLPLFFY